MVGNVAALVAQKGHHHLIEAASIVVRDVPDARFVIVGDGELREALERQIKDKHLERHIFLAGFRIDALEMTKGFDIFALSSLHEGSCVAVIDAMAAGRPVVATSAGGTAEIVEDGRTGLLVQPRDHHAMARALTKLLKDEALRRRRGEAAIARVRERFTVERMVQETARLYDDLLSKSPAAVSEAAS